MPRTAVTQALDLAKQRGGSFQLVVWRNDQLLIDHESDPGGPDLYWIWSASKPFIALLAWQLAEQGRLDLDAPVSQYWPEFRGGGRGLVTTRHMLQHRSGLPTGPGGQLFDALAMHDWRRSITRLEKSCPRWPPGVKPAYHYLSYGFLLGEVVRRVTGENLASRMRETIFAPLQMRDTYLGLPTELLDRAVPIQAPGPVGAAVKRVLNSARVRQAVIPAGGVSSTAWDLARFYLAMLNGGALDGQRVASQATVTQMATQSTVDGEPDGLLRYPLRYGQGFQLGGPNKGWLTVQPFGTAATKNTFGHNGSNICVGYADPDTKTVVAYLGSKITHWQKDRMMLTRLGDAILTG